MKITVFQESLHKALSFANKNVSVHTQLPVLANVLIKTETGRVKISSTNLETSISFWVSAVVDEPGEITVPARLLTETVASLGPEKIDLETRDNQILLKAGASEISLSGIPAAEFPPLPEFSRDKGVNINVSALQESLAAVSFASSTDVNRPLLTGVRIEFAKQEMVFVATDGYRLSVKRTPATQNTGEGALVVSSRVLTDTLKLMQDEKNGSVEIFRSPDGNQVLFSLTEAQIITRLIEGEYPSYAKIIPGAFLTRTVFSKAEMTRAIKLAAIYARESANIIKMSVDADKITVSANTPQIGSNKTSVVAKTEGQPAEVAFNARFVQDLLGAVTGDEVALELNGPTAPGVFKLPKDKGFLHIIMPVRTQ